MASDAADEKKWKTRFVENGQSHSRCADRRGSRGKLSENLKFQVVTLVVRYQPQLLRLLHANWKLMHPLGVGLLR